MGVAIAPEDIPQTDEHEGFEVHPANWPSMIAFLACDTQWRVAATMAGLIWLGLDYQGVDIVLRRSALDDPDAVFADLQVMEAAALDVLQEARP